MCNDAFTLYKKKKKKNRISTIGEMFPQVFICSFEFVVNKQWHTDLTIFIVEKLFNLKR